MRRAAEAILLVFLVLSCSPRGAAERGGRRVMTDIDDADKSLAEVRKELGAARRRVAVLETVVKQKEQDRTRAIIRGVGFGFLGLAAICAVAAFLLPAKKTFAGGALASAGMACVCFFFASWVAPWMAAIGGLIVLALVGVGIYYVARNWKDLREAFGVTSRVTDTLDHRIEGDREKARPTEDTDKVQAFLAELRTAPRLTRAKLKALRDEVRGLGS